MNNEAEPLSTAATDTESSSLQDRYQSFVNQSLLCVCLHDFEGRLLDVNPATLSLLRYTREEILSLDLVALLAENQRALVLQALREVVHSGSQEKFVEYELRRKDGNTVWVEAEATLVGGNGKAGAIQWLWRDITRRRGFEVTLRRSEEKYRRLVENAHEGILVAQDGLIKFANHRAAEMLGVPANESTPVPFDSFLHPDDQALVFECYQKRLQNQNMPHVFSFRIKDEQGNTRWIEISAVQFSWEGRPATLNFMADVSWRKQAEEALHASEEKYRLLVENANDAIVIIQDERVKFHNPNTEKLLGYYGMEMATTPFTEFLVTEDRDAVIEIHRKIKTGGGFSGPYTFRVRKKTGEEIWVESNAVSIPWEQETALLCFVRDINEQRSLEAQLQHSQKMEAIGRLTGGVAHDFNNMMTVVIGYSDFLIKGLEEEDSRFKGLKGIKKAGEHAAQLTRQLLAFSRKQLLRPQVLDLNVIIQNTDQMLRRVIGEHIELVTTLGHELWQVKADPSQIQQVLMNLVINARDAMPSGGKLTLETNNVELGPEYVRYHMDVKTGSYVMIAVSDTGTGMDEETKCRIFEPFFTTKEQGKGTGLGLATVYGIVKQSGGHIWIYSEPGNGSTFKIYLPGMVEEAGPEESTKAPVESPSGSETVLLVEDDEGLRELVCDVLRGKNYRVLDASDTEEALAICQKHAETIHLLLTDVVMPKMNGPDLAKHLTRIHKEMKVLYMSGYTDNAVVNHGVMDPETFFLEKPFSPEVLLHRVRQILDAPAQKAPLPQ